MSDERLGIMQQRRIEAAVIKPIYEEMKAQLGAAAAQDIIKAAIAKSATDAAQEFAAEVGGKTNMSTFQDIFKHWLKGGALEKEDLKRDERDFHFNVVRCKYAEMYKEMGVGEIGHLLSCHRDATFVEGYDDRIELQRTQTIMGGASHCDFRYHFNSDREKTPAGDG
ncbi:MAG: 2-amino-thiazoline-4-carboxylic acid hydrolase [Nisaea sp.]|jgi:hypothetical protein|nr:2-amino-thiazoline-4-carboxylic acid hydrolase [Nisaea sp.]MDA8574407.1 L-2-amino-thiazoline-4-carboxylic acid hydrolase [Alphaproteobacteria bacterium]OUX95390.1 MAG: 2-amino-thiazoline-4-carboxylic acid hydrolase [Candidatus Endolissoclinum sp. TMED26]